MATSFLPRPASRKHHQNARFAVSLGAAFALLCAVVIDAPDSQAAGGLFELLFGGGGGSSAYNIQPGPGFGYSSGYGHRNARRHHARRSRSHYVHYRRHNGERRVAEYRATERHHIATAASSYAPTRRNSERRVSMAQRESITQRDLQAQKDWQTSALDVEQTNPAERISERRPASPIETIETVSFAESGATRTGAQNRRAVCVRACDGYYFPIATKGSEASAQQSCDRLCPGAQTQVFVMPSGATKMDEAVSARGGETYSAFLARLNPDEAKSKSCGCPQTAGNLNDTAAFLSDLTLRPGDTVITPQGVRVVRRGSRYPFKSTDFLSLAETRDVPRSTRGALFAIERAMKTPYGRLAVASNSEHRHRRHNL